MVEVDFDPTKYAPHKIGEEPFFTFAIKSEIEENVINYLSSFLNNLERAGKKAVVYRSRPTLYYEGGFYVLTTRLQTIPFMTLEERDDSEMYMEEGEPIKHG